MALPLPNTPQVEIVRLTKALYNAAPGNTYLSAFEDSAGTTTNGMTTFANWLASTVSTSAATLATTVVTNLGLTGDVATAATAYLNAGFAADPSNLGRVILDAMNALSTLTTDATYGTAASSFNDVVATAYTYSINTANTSTNLATLQAAAVSDGSNTLTLTTGADVITGTSGVDMITGGLGTLSSMDEIHGGAGEDTLTVTFAPQLATAGAADTAAPIMSGVETLTLTNRNASAVLNFNDIKGVTTLNVGGGYNLGLSAMGNDLTAVNINGMSAVLTLDQATATAATAAYGLTLNLSASTAMDLIWDDDTGSTALVDTLTLNAQTTWGNVSSATSFSGVEKLVLQGAGNVTLNMASAVAGGMSADAFADLTANNTAAGIDASALSGNLTVRLAEAVDINIKGGAGADTFTMTGQLNTNDTLDGGAGADVLNAMLTGGYIRPVVSNVETLNLLVNSTAATADMRDVSGATTMNLMLGTGLVVDKAQTAMSTITVNSSDSTANALTLQYGSAAVASNVTLNLSNGVQSIFQTAAATATALGIGNFTMSGNSGSLTIMAASTANYNVDAVVLSDVTAVTINAASGNLTLSAVGMGTAADTITLQAAAGKAIVVAGAMSAMGADTLSFNAAGASALVDLSAVNVGTANSITIATDAAMSGNLGFSANEIVFQSAAAATGAVNIDTVTINALGGDVNIGSAKFLSGATAINTLFDVNMGSTAVNVGISALVFTDIASAATASEQSITFDVSGTGNFILSAATTVSANLTFSVDTTDLASGSNVTINLSNINNVSAVASAAFGAHSGSYVGVDGVDNIEVGLGAMTVNGGLGNDVITLGNTAVTRVEFSANATGLAGFDTIVGAGAGDVLLFNGSPTALAATGINSGVLNTGTATTAGDIGAASYTALGSAVAATAANWCNIYTAAGDTIIEVWNTTAGTATGMLNGTAAADFVRVTLSNKDFTAITAAFRLDTTASGLSITLL